MDAAFPSPMQLQNALLRVAPASVLCVRDPFLASPSSATSRSMAPKDATTVCSYFFVFFAEGFFTDGFLATGLAAFAGFFAVG